MFFFSLFPLLILFSSTTFPSTKANLICVQGHSPLNFNYNGGSTPCSVNPSFSCTKFLDYAIQDQFRGCSASNCTYPNGTYSPTGGCYNSTDNTKGYCCCYGDNCNGAKGEKEFNKILISGILAVFALLFLI
uniref:Protein sleepless n=2 Tax=Meloidogyne TaxID=189290 RepID=A0A914KI29_MELIC